MLNTCRQVGGALGAAIAIAVLQNRLAAAFPGGASAADPMTYAGGFVGAMQWTLALPTALLVLAGLSCPWIKGRVLAGPTTGPSESANRRVERPGDASPSDESVIATRGTFTRRWRRRKSRPLMVQPCGSWAPGPRPNRDAASGKARASRTRGRSVAARQMPSATV